MNLSKQTKIILMLLTILCLMACLPIVAIWCINTLFPAVAIAYTLSNWFAMFLLILIFSGAHITYN